MFELKEHTYTNTIREVTCPEVQISYDGYRCTRPVLPLSAAIGCHRRSSTGLPYAGQSGAMRTDSKAVVYSGMSAGYCETYTFDVPGISRGLISRVLISVLS
jgi:hypothetical protein